MGGPSRLLSVGEGDVIGKSSKEVADSSAVVPCSTS